MKRNEFQWQQQHNKLAFPVCLFVFRYKRHTVINTTEKWNKNIYS